ncbi:MAG: TetR/AcrR family transcriptional regulator [Bacilli bacterium]|nr:TetR/AcrR family transcriptional regulator [Bacilli bacterium]
MPRTPEQNANIRDKRKAKILKKALKLFAINGFDNVTVDDITEAANCSHGLFYHYFKTREEIYNELLETKKKSYAKFDIPMKEAKEKGGYEGLKLIAGYIEMLSTAPQDVIYFTRLKMLSSFATKTAENNLISTDYLSMIRELIEKGQEEGKIIGGDANQLALCLVDFCNGCSYRRLFAEPNDFDKIPAETILSLLTK